MDRKLRFWAMVGAVMAALKLKDAYDEYRQVPDEEEGLQHAGRTGPIALHSPTTEHAPLPEGLTIDTEIPATRPRRKRVADCCVCCGLRCGIFWKAFGIVCLLFLVWQSVRILFWAAKPSQTGLENMPEFSTSLGCEDTSYVFNPDQTTYSVPFGSQAAHLVELQGGAVGTFVITDGASDATDIQYELTVRTNDKSLLDSVSFKYPTQDEIDEGLANSHVRLSTPQPGKTSCIRYDIVMHVPPQLKTIDIQSHAIAQIQFASEADLNLDALSVAMYAASNNNMLLPKTNIHAKELTLSMLKGWLVGEVSIVDKTSVSTNSGDAVSNLRVFPVTSSDTDKAVLNTRTGAGRSDFFYISDLVAPHREIESHHKSSSKGDLYLTYKEAEFTGKVKLKSQGHTSSGVQGVKFLNGVTYGWVGDATGKDMLTVKTNGWVNLNF